MLYKCISKDQPKVINYEQTLQFFVMVIIAMFLFTLVQRIVKSSFPNYKFRICKFILNTDKQFLAIVTLIFILGLNLEFLKCLLNHALSFVYITKNAEPSISLITR